MTTLFAAMIPVLFGCLFGFLIGCAVGVFAERRWRIKANNRRHKRLWRGVDMDG